MTTNEYCINTGLNLDIKVSLPLKMVASSIQLPLQAADSVMRFPSKAADTFGRLRKALAKAGADIRPKPQASGQCIETFLRAGFQTPEMAANIGRRPANIQDLRQTA